MKNCNINNDIQINEKFPKDNTLAINGRIMFQIGKFLFTK